MATAASLWRRAYEEIGFARPRECVDNVGGTPCQDQIAAVEDGLLSEGMFSAAVFEQAQAALEPPHADETIAPAACRTEYRRCGGAG